MTGIKLVLASSFILFSGFAFANISANSGADKATVAGKILLTVGEVYSKRNDGKITLKRRSKVLEQDEIHVGSGARAQIRMIDAALISLQQNSVLKIKKYRYQKNNQENSALLELLSGGLRTITGKIGKNNKKAYELRTPLATIGIRGTDYEVKVVEGGLYVGVWEGGIDLHSLTTEGNYITLGKEHQFSFAYMNPEGEIKALDAAPAVFSNQHTSGGNTPSTPADDNSSSDEGSKDEALPDPTIDSSLSATFPGDAGLDESTTKAMVINRATSSGVINASTTTTNTATPTFEVNGTVMNSNTHTAITDFTQSIEGYDVSWGSWAGYTSSTNGTNTQMDDVLLWTTYESSSADIVSAKTGTIRYDNVVDSLSSGSQGGVSNLDVNMDVNFDSGAVSNGVLSANTSSDTWVGLFDGQVQNGDLNLQMNDARVLSSDPSAPILVRDASGSINGDFIGDQAQGVIGAFELSEDNSTNHIEGVFIVEPK